MNTRTVTLGTRRNKVRNEILTAPLEGGLFLEFGKREDYQYISVMSGNHHYKRGKEAHQLYFAHYIGGKWRVLDNSCLVIVEDYKTEHEAIIRLLELAHTKVETRD